MFTVLCTAFLGSAGGVAGALPGSAAGAAGTAAGSAAGCGGVGLAGVLAGAGDSCDTLGYDSSHVTSFMGKPRGEKTDPPRRSSTS